MKYTYMKIVDGDGDTESEHVRYCILMIIAHLVKEDNLITNSVSIYRSKYNDIQKMWGTLSDFYIADKWMSEDRGIP
jgi:hypothetical protein